MYVQFIVCCSRQSVDLQLRGYGGYLTELAAKFTQLILIPLLCLPDLFLASPEAATLLAGA